MILKKRKGGEKGMPEDGNDVQYNNRSCGCGNNGLGNLFGGCGCDSSILFFIIIFLLLFTNCGCGCNR